MNRLFLLLIPFSASFAVHGAPSTVPTIDCKSRLELMDESFKFGMIITNPKERLYQDEADFNRDYCLPMRNKTKEMASYKPCLKQFPRKVFSMVVTNGRKQVRKICGSTEQRTELVDNLKCITKDNFGQAAQVGHDITTLVEFILRVENQDMVIPVMCCGYELALRRSKMLLNKLCMKEGVGSSGSEYILSILKGSVSEAMDMMCAGYTSIGECNEKNPGIIRILKAVQRRNRNKKYDHSPLVPMLKVIERIDAEG